MDLAWTLEYLTGDITHFVLAVADVDGQEVHVYKYVDTCIADIGSVDLLTFIC